MMLVALTLLGCPKPGGTRDADVPPPTVDALFETFVAQTAMPEHTSRRTDFVLSMPAQGIEGPLVIWNASDPDRMLMDTDLAGIGRMVTGYDGEVAWANDPIMGPRVMEGEELDALVFSASFDADADWRSRYADLVVSGPVEFDGQQAWQVKGNMIAFKSPYTAWFAVDSGLMIGTEFKTPTGMGKLKSTSMMRDYGQVDGMLVPRTVLTRSLGMEQVMTVQTIELDPPELPDFGPPESVRALLE
jgi:hypothetical protein